MDMKVFSYGYIYSFLAFSKAKKSSLGSYSHACALAFLYVLPRKEEEEAITKLSIQQQHTDGTVLYYSQ